MSQNRLVKLQDIFSVMDNKKALDLVSSGHVLPSFERGKPEEGFYTSSALIDELERKSEVRLTIRRDNSLKSQCNCPYWQEDKHCYHVLALILASGQEKRDLDEGVHPERFGSIILGPEQLGKFPFGKSPTYSFIKYKLTSGKTKPFPETKAFTGKLGIEFSPEEGEIQFYHNNDGVITKEISLFENLYLFNWNTGEVCSLPREVKEFLRPILKNLRLHRPKNWGVEYYIQKTLKSKILEFQMLGEVIREELLDEGKLRISFIQSKTGKVIELAASFENEEGQLISLSPFFKEITFDDGRALTYFEKKIDAYHFLKDLSDSFDDSEKERKVSLRIPERLLNCVRWVKENSYFLGYCYEAKKIYKISNRLIIDYFQGLILEFNSKSFQKATSSGDVFSLSIALTNFTDGISSLHTRLKDYPVRFFYNQQTLSSFRPNVSFKRSTGEDWFNLKMRLTKGDLTRLKTLDPKQAVNIVDGELILLEDADRELISLVKKYAKEGDLNQEGEEAEVSLSFKRSRIFEIYELKKVGLGNLLKQEELELCEKLESTESVPEYPIPESVHATLRPYQEFGYRWLRFLHEFKLGGCLADDMGLGKTLQTICFIESLPKDKRVLIVTPVSLLLNWEAEFMKFTPKKINLYYGSDRKISDDDRIVITSYGIVRREIETTFQGQKFDCLIMDEVQWVKNAGSLGAKAIRRLDTPFRLSLTGTPVENHMSEFYNIMDLSLPGLWGGHSFSKSASDDEIDWARKVVSPFLLRRTKDEVLSELPDKEESLVYLNFTEQEQRNYSNELEDIQMALTSPVKAKQGEIFKYLLKLRLSCLWQGALSSKADYLMQTIEPIVEQGHQILVFSQFTSYLDFIEEKLKSAGHQWSRIDGSMAAKRRMKEVDTFQEGKTPIFLISLKAGGQGLNLTAASFVFIMDPWWNPAVEAQAVNRAHRIGQTQKLTVYRPVIKGTIEEKVLKLQEEKKELFDRVVKAEKISLEVIKNLILG